MAIRGEYVLGGNTPAAVYFIRTLKATGEVSLNGPYTALGPAKALARRLKNEDNQRTWKAEKDYITVDTHTRSAVIRAKSWKLRNYEYGKFTS